MGLLDNIVEMQSQGLSEEDIVENLRQQGFSPREINEAFSQLSIREAVSSEMAAPDFNAEAAAEFGEGGGDAGSFGGEGGGYGAVDSGGQGFSNEGIADIVGQIVEGKMGEMKKTMASLNSMKEDFERKVKEMEDRMKKVEEDMENLQRSIIGKVGDYGKSIEGIHNEMQMMQDSFGKMINPYVDKVRGVKKKDSGEDSEEEVSRENFNFDVLKKIGKK